jgi:outer membrane lipoprotein carrier protein
MTFFPVMKKSEPVTTARFFWLLLLLMPGFSLAQQPAENLQQLLDQMDRFQAGFTQTVVEDDGYVLDEQEGILSFEKPNRIFWEVTEPYRTTLVADGENIYFLDEDLNQVRVRPWSNNPAENPAAVFVGEGLIRDYYHVEKSDGSFVLTPREEEAGYQSLTLTFDSGRPVQMTLSDSLGQITDIQFGPLDQPIPEQPYQFSIPADAEVIIDD